MSGRVVYVDVTFGGFFGLGVHHHTIPWEKLTYAPEYSGYRTDITAEQVKGAPAFYGNDQIWPDRKRETEATDYWRNLPPFLKQPGLDPALVTESAQAFVEDRTLAGAERHAPGTRPGRNLSVRIAP